MSSNIANLKQRALTAWQTMRRLPVGRIGPSMSMGYWPEYVLDYPEAREFKRIPSASEIADAEDFQALVNSTLDEAERKELWVWCRLKDRREKSSSIQGYCEKYGLKEHKYRRQIDNIFQKLAAKEKNNPSVRPEPPVDEHENIGRLGAQSDVICSDGIVAWRPEASRPVIDRTVRSIALGAIKKSVVGP